MLPPRREIHRKGRNVKSLNCLTALYHSQGVSLPVASHLIAKTESYLDKQSGKLKYLVRRL